MKTAFHLSILLALATGVSCSDGRRADAPQQKPAPLTISVQGPAEDRAAWASVEVIPVPAVQFTALIRPDPNHMSPLTSPTSGVISRIRPEGHVMRDEPVATIVQGAPATGRELTIAAKRDGVWHPRRQASQLTAANDTVGVLQEHGYWLAVGAVDAAEYRAIHPGDSALVQLTDDRHHAQRGRVEWVRAPWQDAPYTADIAVEFEGSDSQPRALGAITVIVLAGPGDSGSGVPPSAIAHLPPGPAVFVPGGEGRYEVRWITTGPRMESLVFVREGLKPGTSIVARGLAPLVDAALDSLERRPRKQ